MASHIDVVGLGVAADAVLPASARAALASARVIIGSPRQQAWLNRQPGDWPPMEDLPPLANLEEKLAAIPGAVAVLASGDPLHYGIGHWFSRHYAPDQLAFHPAVSSIQAMCSRLGLSQPHCHVITLHGRPAASIRRHLVAGRTLIVLTDRTSNPVFLARACCERSRGWSTSSSGRRPTAPAAATSCS